MSKKVVMLIIAASFLLIVTVPIQSHVAEIHLYDQIGGS